SASQRTGSFAVSGTRYGSWGNWGNATVFERAGLFVYYGAAAIVWTDQSGSRRTGASVVLRGGLPPPGIGLFRLCPDRFRAQESRRNEGLCGRGALEGSNHCGSRLRSLARYLRAEERSSAYRTISMPSAAARTLG